MGYFAKGRQARADGIVAWNTNRLLLYVLDVDDLGPSAGAWKVTGATIPSGSTVRITTQANHGLTVNDEIEIWGVGGITGAQGIFNVTSVVNSTTFEFTGSTPSGTYTSGGYLINLTAYTFMSEINVSGNADVGKVAIPTTGRSTTNGVIDAPNLVIANVPGPDAIEAWAIVKAADTDVSTNDANETVQRLLICETPATSGLTGLPQTPNNGNINIDFPSQGIGRV